MIGDAAKFMMQEPNAWVDFAILIALICCLVDNNVITVTSSQRENGEADEKIHLDNYYGGALSFLIYIAVFTKILFHICKDPMSNPILLLPWVIFVLVSQTVYSNLEVEHLVLAALVLLIMCYFLRGIISRMSLTTWVSSVRWLLESARTFCFSLSSSEMSEGQCDSGTTSRPSSESGDSSSHDPPSDDVGTAILDDSDASHWSSLRLETESRLPGASSGSGTEDQHWSEIPRHSGCEDNFRGFNHDSCSSLIHVDMTAIMSGSRQDESAAPEAAVMMTPTTVNTRMISSEEHRTLENTVISSLMSSTSSSSLKRAPSLKDAFRHSSDKLLPRDDGDFGEMMMLAATGSLVDSSPSSTATSLTTAGNDAGKGRDSGLDPINIGHDGADAGTNPEIMCVEDDKIQRLVIEKILGKYGFRLTMVVSGEQALECLATRQHAADFGDRGFPAIILMDVMLPGMSGFEASEAIRRDYPLAPLPIVMVTDGSTETTMQALSSGANDVVENARMGIVLTGRIFSQLTAQRFWRSKLAAQKNKSLLQEILPPSIIDRIGPRDSRHLVYDEHKEQVSIVFTHIIGFTDMMSMMSSTSSRPIMMKLLDDIFNEFDSLSKKYDVYKIETIGDSYMLVAGHEEDSEGDHALRAVHIAAEMLDIARGFKMPNGEPLRIQAGIHSGPAFSGVIGSLRPRYSFFGDTVNVASRMESTSFADCIQLSSSAHDCYDRQSELPPQHSDASDTSISKNTYSSRIALECPQLEIVRLGKREIKGKGEMDTSLVKTGDWTSALKRYQYLKSANSLPSK